MVEDLKLTVHVTCRVEMIEIADRIGCEVDGDLRVGKVVHDAIRVLEEWDVKP